jgi:hypothetical protein
MSVRAQLPTCVPLAPEMMLLLLMTHYTVTLACLRRTQENAGHALHETSAPLYFTTNRQTENIHAYHAWEL